ncbi:MAG: family 78 glycoside hydrolase catalytic domain [Kiritimatiellia bacterium]
MKKIVIVCASAVLVAGCVSRIIGKEKIKTVELQTCRLSSPSNIVKPVFSWKMVSSRRGARQTAYRIKVGSSEKTVWDSGIVSDDCSAGIEYTGPALKSATEYVWEVSVRDETGAWLEPVRSVFTTGLLDRSNWEGSAWIAVPGQDIITAGNAPKNEHSVPGTSCFVKSLDLGGKVEKAYWTVTGQGVFEAYVNGVRVGNDFLKPGFTHVFKTRHAFTYDVTELLSEKNNENVFAAMVSSGWWRDKIVGYRGRESAFRAQLTVRYADGSGKNFGTDDSWFGAVAGPVKRASIFEGEVYDASETMEWTKKGGSDSFRSVKTIDEFKGEIVPAQGSPVCLREDLVMLPVRAYVWQGVEGGDKKDRFGKVRIIRTYKSGVAITLSPGETLVVDFGQNAAAEPRFTASAAAGTEITLLPAEMLNDENGLKSRGNDGPEGSVYRLNLRNIHKEGAQAIYTFAGENKETYMPRFTFFGYRYLSLTATDRVTINKLESVPVTSIAKELETGRIKTGEENVNQLISNVLWGQYSNYLSVPTDCPQRNERLGWTADTQVFAAAASCNADVYGFLSKWMRDMRDSQLETTGSYPSVAPLAQYGNEGDRFGWADAGIIVPHTMWRRYGDTSIIKENWASMKKFMARLDETKHVTLPGKGQYADWLSYEKYQPCNAGWGKNPPKEALEYWNFLGACYWLWDARMMTDMARAISENTDEKIYRRMAAKALAHIRSTYVMDDGLLSKTFRDLQTASLFALKLGLLKDEKAVAETKSILMNNIKNHGDCLQTGFLGTSILMNTLTYDADAPEMAYTLLLQHKNPSWLYSVDQGATTIWERWNSYVKATGFGPASMNSFNHYAYGAVLAWMYNTMAGIREDISAPGFKHFILAPVPDRRVGKVTAEYNSAYGTIRSAWKYDENSLWSWTFTVPANTSASVTIPGGETKEYTAGSYRIIRNLPENPKN